MEGSPSVRERLQERHVHLLRRLPAYVRAKTGPQATRQVIRAPGDTLAPPTWRSRNRTILAASLFGDFGDGLFQRFRLRRKGGIGYQHSVIADRHEINAMALAHHVHVIGKLPHIRRCQRRRRRENGQNSDGESRQSCFYSPFETLRPVRAEQARTASPLPLFGLHSIFELPPGHRRAKRRTARPGLATRRPPSAEPQRSTRKPELPTLDRADNRAQRRPNPPVPRWSSDLPEIRPDEWGRTFRRFRSCARRHREIRDPRQTIAKTLRWQGSGSGSRDQARQQCVSGTRAPQSGRRGSKGARAAGYAAQQPCDQRAMSGPARQGPPKTNRPVRSSRPAASCSARPQTCLAR